MPAPTCPPVEYFTAISALLTTCGASFLGSEHLTDAMSPPRYTWVPAAEAWSPDAPRDFAMMGAFDTTFVIHVYGNDFVHTWRLRHALLTALRTSSCGTFSIGNAEWPLRDKGAKGQVCLQTISIRIPIPAQAYPATLGATIVDDEPLTAQADEVGTVTPSFGS